MKIVLALAVAGFAGPALWSAARPDFTGTWKLDILRSRMDEKAEPKNLVLRVEHHEPAIRIAVADAKSSGGGDVLDLTTDGAERDGTLGGQPVTASASWDQWGGNHLILTIKQKGGGSEQTTSREMILGEKRRILTTIMQVRDGSGKRTSYEFFVRE
jgi:hypothetical protein